MVRRLLVASVLALGLAACGGSSATPTPTPAPTASPTGSPVVTPAPESVAPSAPAGATTATAICDAVSLRKSPSTGANLLGRAYHGAQVRVVATVTGDAYTAGTCGASGDSWLKIDRISGKSVQALYGVPFAYSAAGFYK